MSKHFRVGIGRDLHRLRAGRPLVLGGVRIPHPRGPLGHSDADVLLHAVCDALLGAGALGDIGEHFPDTDTRWKNATSSTFVRHALRLLERKGLAPAHLDTTVYARAPKLGPYKTSIRRNLAGLLGLPLDRVNLKAKTFDAFGYSKPASGGSIGRGEAIGADAIVSVVETRRRRVVETGGHRRKSSRS